MLSNRDIFDLLAKFKYSSTSRPDDLADELNFKYSSIILIMFCVIITYNQYLTTPISCYLATGPKRIKIEHYLAHYCWVTGTIPITYNGEIPTSDLEFRSLDKEKILYYQWVPFILAIQAVLCYVPQLLWRLMYTTNTESDLKQLIMKASKASYLQSDARSQQVHQLSHILETLLFQARECKAEKPNPVHELLQKVASTIVFWKRKGTPLIVSYSLIKILYLINSIGQMCLMKAYLKLDNYTVFGIDILHNIVSGKDWNRTIVFPREAYCFAKVRHLGVINYMVAQCALPINMLNEKFYIFYFFWLFIVTIATFISLIIWISSTIIKTSRTSFVKKCLMVNNQYSCGDILNKRIRKFEMCFLRNNGTFILQMLANNAGEIITAEVVTHLWKIYRRKYEKCIPCNVTDTVDMELIAQDSDGTGHSINSQQQSVDEVKFKCDDSD